MEQHDLTPTPAADAADNLPPDHRSGFVAVIGRPNVGKSTLLNRLLGQKIAITSPKPQTTRDQLLGILTLADAQLLFLDTPGIHKPQHKLGEHMVEVAAETVDDADVVLLADIFRRRKPTPLVLGLNKLDTAGNADTLAQRQAEYGALLATLQRGPAQTAVFSALTGEGIDALLTLLRGLLPLGPRYYPEDQVTDLQTRFIVAELIREKALHLLQQEVPHSLAVIVEEFTARSAEMTYIAATVYVERDSQKGIVLGQGGRTIKRIGQAARPEIEELVGTRVYLELWVKVWEKWRRKEAMLRRLGYAT